MFNPKKSGGITEISTSEHLPGPCSLQNLQPPTWNLSHVAFRPRIPSCVAGMPNDTRNPPSRPTRPWRHRRHGRGPPWTFHPRGRRTPHRARSATRSRDPRFMGSAERFFFPPRTSALTAHADTTGGRHGRYELGLAAVKPGGGAHTRAERFTST